jgi:hypothetical protein
MNDRPPSPTATDDDWLDGVLRADGLEHRAAYIDDAGFTARVMAALPEPAALPAWRKPALAALWAVAGIGIALALPGVVFDVAHAVAHDAVRLLVGQSVSLKGLAAGVAAVGAATWAAAAMALRED